MLVGDETVLKRFLAEAEATMRLAHDQIVRTYDVFRQGDNYYILMDCLPGGSLEDRLRAQVLLPIQKALRIAAAGTAGGGGTPEDAQALARFLVGAWPPPPAHRRGHLAR